MPLKTLSLTILLIALTPLSCGEKSDSQMYPDLIAEMDLLAISSGEEEVIATFDPQRVRDDSRVVVSFLARYHSAERFTDGSYGLGRVKLNGQPLGKSYFIKEPACYTYPNCSIWNSDPNCMNTCMNYFIGDIGVDFSCGGQSYFHEPLSDMLDIQLSSNFENNMVPFDESGAPNPYFIDPNTSGDPYRFEYDITDPLRSATDSIQISIENPFVEYREYMLCYNPSASAGLLVIADVSVNQLRP